MLSPATSPCAVDVTVVPLLLSGFGPGEYTGVKSMVGYATWFGAAGSTGHESK